VGHERWLEEGAFGVEVFRRIYLGFPAFSG
jgi:hypothetical protein